MNLVLPKYIAMLVAVFEIIVKVRTIIISHCILLIKCKFGQ